jgi:Pyruvate/2-oxoacid:ferredoxin oxidoreductase delta subunit
MDVIRSDRMRLDHYEKKERQEPTALAIEARLSGVDTEVNLGLTAEQVLAESQRCMSCGHCFNCEKCWLFCQDQAVVKSNVFGEPYTFKLENCTGCKKCAEECPCGFINMQ